MSSELEELFATRALAGYGAFLLPHLNDGITFGRGYVPPHNLMSGGIQLPREFRIAIGNALQLSE